MCTIQSPFYVKRKKMPSCSMIEHVIITLLPGDRIVEINGVSMEGLNRKQVG